MNDSVASNAAGSMGDRIVYEFARAQTIDGWWIWAGLVLGILAAIALCVFYYRRDVAELCRPVRWTLIGLRLMAVLSLVFVFFNLVRRTERRVVRPSEVIVLVDTSQSMTLPSGPAVDALTRIETAKQLIQGNDLIARLAGEHRTSVYAFDQTPQPTLIETREIGESAGSGNEPTESAPGDRSDASVTNPFAIFGLFCLVVAVVAAIVALGMGLVWPARAAMTSSGPTRRDETIGWSLLIAAITMVTGIISLGGVYCVQSDQTLLAILGLADQVNRSASPGSPEDAQEVTLDAPVQPVDWETSLVASGTQSRIGDALRTVLVDHDPTTLAGIVLVTDGQLNGGAALSSALALARRGEVPVYPVGLGSSRPPTNVRVVDLEAPRRVYPGDKFAVSAVLQATGENQLSVDVELIDALDDGKSIDEASDPATASTSLAGGEVIERRRIELPTDATLTGVRFEMAPETVGRRRLAVRVVAPPEDRNRADDMQTARYEVVTRRLKVLAIAGGPTREYRFVRNLFFRDASIELDVWLQTGQPGMSQDADRLLTEFPATPEELFDYDAVVMFDPDWSAIDSASLDLIDRFLTQQAGGLVLIAGPVYHPRLSRARNDARTSQIDGFFPVNLASGGPLLGGGRQGGEDAWPLSFTDEATQAEFLWIGDDAQSSFEQWRDFAGVYDYVGVKSAKPGAKVYAYFSDPTSEVSGSLPVFMSSQFYGAGRVFFLGSGEMWRLRGQGDEAFDAFYTKLIRWVSEGRLLRDSKRGVLLVDTSRAMIGQTVTLRAVLVDDQFQPLEEPSVTAKLLTPDGKIKDLTLSPAADSPRGGTYTGNFVATAAGGYEIELTVGDALDEQVLRQSVQVRLPTSELERPRRADDELAQLASATRGDYYPVDASDSVESVAGRLVRSIAPQPQVTLLPGTPDAIFNLRRNAILMWLVAAALTFEWVVRRLHKLA